MSFNQTTPSAHWHHVQKNPTYWAGAISDSEAAKITWHSPTDERSSQIFCISVFGELHHLPEWNEILAGLFSDILPAEARIGPWPRPRFEYTDRSILGETGSGKPTNVDVFLETPRAVVCVESKFLYDAADGFGGCGQIANGNCRGFYGAHSDHKTRQEVNCRLEARDGKRDPRRYWEIGRQYFQTAIFHQQSPGDHCPFAGPNFQLMRNFLFAARSAGPARSCGILAIVPAKTASEVTQQVAAFRSNVLQVPFQSMITSAAYDSIAEQLAMSADSRSRGLSRFIRERIRTLT